MIDTQWGPPLTVAQMEALRDAGLPKGIEYQFFGLRSGQWMTSIMHANRHFQHEQYRLPANHPAYTLLAAGWLDGRNVRLWFGGDKAPDDWDSTTMVLLASGFTVFGDSDPDGGLDWRHALGGGNVIAYIAKVEDAIMDHLDSLLPPEDEYMPEIGFDSNEVDMGEIFRNMVKTRTSPETHSDRTIGRGLPDFEQPETVTIAKMTEAEARSIWGHYIGVGSFLAIMENLGLIKPEPTREERFWTLHKPEGTTIPTHIKKWVKDALEFER